MPDVVTEGIAQIYNKYAIHDNFVLVNKNKQEDGDSKD